MGFNSGFKGWRVWILNYELPNTKVCWYQLSIKYILCICWLYVVDICKMHCRHSFKIRQLDVHGSVHHNINLIEITNMMRPCGYRQLSATQTYVKPEAAITVFELLKMSGVSLETCWAIKKHWNNKFYYTVAFCWLFL